MDAVVCDVCDRRVERPATQEQLRFEIPIFQNPERFMMQQIDLCMSCGLEFSAWFIGFKNERKTVKS